MEETQNKRDYKPLINSISKYAIYIGLIALIISVISLIVLGSKDYTKNKEYSYKQSIFGAMISVDIILKDGGTFVETAIFPDEPVEINTGKYFVKDGTLYVDYSYDDGTYEDYGFEEYGKISATKISIESEGLALTMVCKPAKTQQNISITFTVIGSILLVAGLIGKATIKYLENKNTDEE